MINGFDLYFVISCGTFGWDENRTGFSVFYHAAFIPLSKVGATCIPIPTI